MTDLLTWKWQKGFWREQRLAWYEASQVPRTYNLRRHSLSVLAQEERRMSVQNSTLRQWVRTPYWKGKMKWFIQCMQQPERMDCGKHRSSNVQSGVLCLVVFKFFGIHNFYFMMVIAIIFIIFVFISCFLFCWNYCGFGVGQIAFQFYHLGIYATLKKLFTIPES